MVTDDELPVLPERILANTKTEALFGGEISDSHSAGRASVGFLGKGSPSQ